jgi:uncharacterized protein YndB with AHSA1/START domain
MGTETGQRTRVAASRIIRASRQALYQAFMDPDALVAWLPPAGMKGHVRAFDSRQGGGYLMSLTYLDPAAAGRGKTTADSDLVNARFVELVAGEKIVQRVDFVTGDPAFAGEMTITWTFTEAASGTEVAVSCEDAPPGIGAADHEAGMRSSLENLAAFVG